MPQPHKGDRVYLGARIDAPVYSEIKRRATADGVPLTQVVADLLAAAVGREDLVRQVRPEEGLPLAM